MIKSKTLFVVGAGASCEARLPSGPALRDQIANDVRFENDGLDVTGGDVAVRRALYTANARGGYWKDVFEAAERMQAALPVALSIDNYLDAHAGDPATVQLGKIAIANAIQRAEEAGAIQPGDDRRRTLNLSPLRDTWFVKTLQLLTENVGRSDVFEIITQIDFLTFNYDRCIERFFPSAISMYYGLDEHEHDELAKRLSVTHAYGGLGSLSDHVADRHPYGARGNIEAAAGRIRTFTERIEDPVHLGRMRSLVAEAEVIVFLGFAFHRQNLEMISPEGGSGALHLYATTLGMSEADRSDVIADIQRIAPLAVIHAENTTCSLLMEENRRSLSR